ncbi:MAG: metal ABC transporter permease [Verrucomicrobiota bacterium]
MDSWIVAIGALCAVACSLPGCFLVLRRMSMMGDAISHAVLPGLAIAFLVSGSRASVIMFVGAAIVGVLTAVFTQWISSWGKVDRGASMGIVFTTLFALGLLLIVQAASHVELDAGCVLYGALELTPLDVVAEISVGSTILEVPRAFIVLGIVALLNLFLVILFFKEFRLSSFDPSLGDTIGVSSGLMHYLLMTMVAVTTVASFEAVGSIIVIAMLVVPAATAQLLTDRLGWMLPISAVLGMVAAAAGHIMALTVPVWFGFEDTNTSGMMAVAAGLLFLAAFVLSPRYGLLSKYLARKGLSSKGAPPIPSEAFFGRDRKDPL